MVKRVEYAPDALADLELIFDRVASASNAARAEAYLLRISRRCEVLAMYPFAVQRWAEAPRELRILGFERLVSIDCIVSDTGVVVQRALYGGRDLAP